MRVYKELEALGFFKWYCAQYGSLNYQEYESVYDDLPLDNLIRTQLNACAFKFFREKRIDSEIKKIEEGYTYHCFRNQEELGESLMKLFTDDRLLYVFNSHEDAEAECLKKLIEITKL